MKKIIACIGTFFALVTLSTQAKNPYLLQTADRSAMEHWVDSVFETLSPKERIAQLLVITVRNSDTPQNRKTLQRLIQEQKIGGLLFDSGTAKDQANLTNYCQSLSKVPLMVTLDGEWGLAMRSPFSGQHDVGSRSKRFSPLRIRPCRREAMQAHGHTCQFCSGSRHQQQPA